MKRILVEGIIAVPIFIALAWWNSAVAVLFGIAALTWILAELYRLSQGGDIFPDRDRRGLGGESGLRRMRTEMTRPGEP